MSETRSRPVVFIHIPKTAGKTLAKVIESQYPAEAIYEIHAEHQAASIEEFRALPAERRDRIQLLRGHFGFGLHVYLRQPATYITMLRDPIERLISHYYYVRGYIERGGNLSGRTWLQEAASMTLDEYVSHASSADARNGQTKLLAGEMLGWDPETQSARDDASLLEAAQRNLRENVAVVGLTERFDESLMLLKRRLGWGAPYYVKTNVTSHRPSRHEVPANIVRRIESANLLDLELYATAKQRLEREVRELGPSFARELAWFRFANRRYGELMRLRALARSRLRTFKRRAS